MSESQPRAVAGGAHDQAAGITPYPDEPSAPRAAASEALYQCQACGSTFTLRETADGAELPDVRAFLAQHRRCVRQLLTAGGSFARQSVRRAAARRPGG